MGLTTFAPDASPIGIVNSSRGAMTNMRRLLLDVALIAIVAGIGAASTRHHLVAVTLYCISILLLVLAEQKDNSCS